MRTSMIIVIGFLSVLQSAHAQDTQSNRARLAWAAFTCGTFAELSGNKEEQQRLFQLGFDIGRQFLQEVINQTITEGEMKDAPIGVTMLLGGPSADFMLGRIFESAVRDAYDQVVRQGSDGAALSEPIMDDKLRAILAETQYHKANCVLIR